MKKFFEVWFYFLRLGLMGFGGPLALIAQMQKELVLGRKWISHDEFLRALPLIKSMPGPVAYQAAIYLAHRRVGRLGALIAGFLFVAPSFLMMVALAMGSGSIRENSWIASFLAGAQAVALVLIFWALRDLTTGRLADPRFWAYVLFALFLLSIVNIPEPVVILGCGALAVWGKKLNTSTVRSASMEVFWICFKAGALAFGTGLSIIPLLESDFLRWIDRGEFLEAVAFGQITPGPVVITVAYLGFKISGWTGASLATLGVYLPGTINILTWFPALVNKLAKSQWIGDFILGSLAALASAILISLVSLGQNLRPLQFGIMVAIIALGFRFRIAGYLWVLLGGGLHLILHLVLS